MDASTIQSLDTTRYVTLAAFILYLYDWVLVIPQEVHLFRLTRSSVGKHLYYAIRIASVCGMSLMMYHTSSFRPDLSQTSCMVFTWIWPSLLVITMYACYWLLTLRLVALFRSRKSITYALYGILFSSLLATFVFQIHVQVKYSSAVNNSNVGLCLPPPAPTQDSDIDWNFAYSFFPPLLVEIALTLLTAYRAFYDLRFYLHTRRVTLAAKAQSKGGIVDKDVEGRKKTRPGQFVALPTVLYRDGASFSLVVIALRVWNLIILMTQPRTSMYMAIAALWTALATLTTRMYLNLCDVIQREPPPSAHPETRQLALLGATRHQSLIHTRPSTMQTAGNFPPSSFGYNGRYGERDSRSSLAYADYRPSTAPSRYGTAHRPSTGSSISPMVGIAATDSQPKKKKTPAPYVPAYPPPMKKEKKGKEGKAARWFGLTSDPTSSTSTPLAITTTVTTTTTATSPMERRVSFLDRSIESGGATQDNADVQEVTIPGRPYEFYPRRHHREECDSNASTPMSTTVRFSMLEDGELAETSDNGFVFDVPTHLNSSEFSSSDNNIGKSGNKTEQV